jgi:hypothetical protein
VRRHAGSDVVGNSEFGIELIEAFAFRLGLYGPLYAHWIQTIQELGAKGVLLPPEVISLKKCISRSASLSIDYLMSVRQNRAYVDAVSGKVIPLMNNAVDYAGALSDLLKREFEANSAIREPLFLTLRTVNLNDPNANKPCPAFVGDSRNGVAASETCPLPLSHRCRRAWCAQSENLYPCRLTGPYGFRKYDFAATDADYAEARRKIMPVVRLAMPSAAPPQRKPSLSQLVFAVEVFQMVIGDFFLPKYGKTKFDQLMELLNNGRALMSKEMANKFADEIKMLQAKVQLALLPAKQRVLVRADQWAAKMIELRLGTTDQWAAKMIEIRFDLKSLDYKLREAIDRPGCSINYRENGKCQRECVFVPGLLINECKYAYPN